MNKTIAITSSGLKHFLKLFDPAAKLEIQELGDTGHPSSGFVDEDLVKDVRTVKSMLDFDYEFDGLVVFDATIADAKVRFDSRTDNSQLQFIVEGPSKDLEKVIIKIKLDQSYACNIYNE